MQITKEKLREIDELAYDVYAHGGQWDAIVLIVLDSIGVTVKDVDMTKALKWHGLKPSTTRKETE